MHTIKIDVSDTLYEKVMGFLKQLPQKDVKLYEVPSNKDKQETLVEFFQKSPLHDISLTRENEVYEGRMDFRVVNYFK